MLTCQTWTRLPRIRAGRPSSRRAALKMRGNCSITQVAEDVPCLITNEGLNAPRALFSLCLSQPLFHSRSFGQVSSRRKLHNCTTSLCACKSLVFDCSKVVLLKLGIEKKRCTPKSVGVLLEVGHGRPILFSKRLFHDFTYIQRLLQSACNQGLTFLMVKSL